MLLQGEKNYKTVKTIKYKTLSLNLFKPELQHNLYKRAPPIHLTKFKVQLKECKVEQLMEQDRTAEEICDIVFGSSFHLIRSIT